MQNSDTHFLMSHLHFHYNFPSQPQRDCWILDPFILFQFISPILDLPCSPPRGKPDHQVVLHSLPDIIYFKKTNKQLICWIEDHDSSHTTKSWLSSSIENECFKHGVKASLNYIPRPAEPATLLFLGIALWRHISRWKICHGIQHLFNSAIVSPKYSSPASEAALKIISLFKNSP